MTTPSATGDLKSEGPTAAPSGASVPEAPPAQSAPKPTATAPPGFKLVKVRKPDGTIVTVKRKLSPEEAAGTGNAVLAPATTTSNTSGEAFKIVTVRQPDGTLVKVKRPVKDQEDTPASAPRKESNEGAAEKTTAKPLTTESSPAEAKREAKEPVASGAKDAPAPADQKKDDASATRTVAIGSSAPVAAENTSAEADQAAIQEALDEQTNFFRQRKTHQFKARLLRGVAAIAGSAVPAIEIGDHFMDGDEIISDDDWSVDEDDDHDYEDDDDHDGHDDHDNTIEAAHDLHHGAQDGQSRSADDDDKTLGNNSSGMSCPSTASLHCPIEKADISAPDSGGHVTIDAGAAVQGAAMAAAAAGTQPVQRQPLSAAVAPAAAPAAAPAPGDKENAEREKVTYKITAKELNHMEDKTAEKVSRPLKKHWANMTFYIMASLSIVLPLLFIRELTYQPIPETDLPFANILP